MYGWPSGGHAVRRRFEEYDLNGGAGAKGAEPQGLQEVAIARLRSRAYR